MIDRRQFLQSTGGAALVTMITPSSVVYALRNQATATLEAGFTNPPHSAKPYTWWHWMNGNITKAGITLDLEAMERVGIGGVQCFNVGSGIPKGPVDYLGTEWVELTQHALREAGRLGLEFDIHNCPGWSSTGGPWITPELSMQQLVWTETGVIGGQQNIQLPRPFSKLDFYKDTLVLAFPALPGAGQPAGSLIRNITSGNAPVDRGLLFTPDFSKGFDVVSASVAAPGNVLLEFAEPVEARSITVFCAPLPGTPGGGATSPALILESSADGRAFTRITEFNRVGNNIEMPATGSFAPVKAAFYRLLVHQPVKIAGVRLSASASISNWAYKSGFPGNGGSGGALKTTASYLVPDTFVADPASVIDPATVLDITQHFKPDGSLDWVPPAGNWTILRLGHTPTGRRNNAAPESGAGLECDKFSREVYDFHFNKMFEHLLPVMQEVAPKSKVGVLVDSYEVGMQNWTPRMREAFRQRRGYDFLQYLPAMTGRVVGSVDTTERFLWDLRRTHADLMADNYHGFFAELCKKHGLLAYTEPYNNGPFEEMQVGAKVDVNMGEFWIRGPHFFPSVKLAASIAHVYGKRVNGMQVVGAESFTGDAVHSKWQESPYALKAQGDYMYTKGLNRFIFHRYAHQPHPTAAPGMTMGPWGFHFDRTNTWFEKGRQWLRYVSRCQGVLQQGLFVADILYFTGEDAPGEDFSMMGTPDPAPPEGFDYDFINREAVLDRITIRKGLITLPDGMSYRVLVLPPKRTMSVTVMRKLDALVRQGMILVGLPPVSTPGLSTGADADLKKLTASLWGSTDGAKSGEREAGKGRVMWAQDLGGIMSRLNIMPDVQWSAATDAPVNYIHRKIGGDDVYFVANKRRTREEVLATFRVSGRQPEIWNADTGDITPVDIFDATDGGTKVPLQFEPAGSCFVVFRKPAGAKSIRSVERNGISLVSTTPFTKPAMNRYAGVTNNFTITAWVKPETEENLTGAFALNRGLASNVFYPVEGELVYGKNHVACGLIAARNGLLVYERAAGFPVHVLVAPAPLAGWSHVALVYKAGAPAVYLNGRLLKEGAPSGKLVHPGLGFASQDYTSWFFEGDMSGPVLVNEALDASRIQQLIGAGRPLPPEPLPVQVAAHRNGGILIWADGTYRLENRAGGKREVAVTGIGQPAMIDTPWKVAFPPNLGAPATITLDKLASLHHHPEPGVKYFSGTCTYSADFTFQPDTINKNKRYFLDLGRVEVLAEVTLNGKALGVLWKPPYQVEVTGALQPGTNRVEVQVTNLWPNRLIGDEQLPPEHAYGNVSGGGVSNVSGGGGIQQLPDWYVAGRPKPPGGRITFTTWKHYNPDSPLLESGLAGPVIIRTAIHLPV